jgi:hypothetical protein
VTLGGRPGRARRWPAGLAWALFVLVVVELAGFPWLDRLLRDAGRPAHALVAPVEHRGVVVVAKLGVLQHPLQVAHDSGGAQVRSPGGDQRLVHVQGDRERAVDTGDVHRRLTQEHRLVLTGPDRRLDPLFRAAQVRQAIDALGKLAHDLLRPLCCATFMPAPAELVAAANACMGAQDM